MCVLRFITYLMKKPKNYFDRYRYLNIDPPKKYRPEFKILQL